MFWTAYYADGGLLIRQLRAVGLPGHHRGRRRLELARRLFNIAGKAAEGVFAFSNPTAEFLPEAKAFGETYKAQFGNDPGPYAPLTYDGMQLLAWAIGEAGSTEGPAVIEALKKADCKEWLAGPISFTDKNTLARSNFIVLESARTAPGRWAD